MSFLDHFRRKSPEPENHAARTAAARNEIAKKIVDLGYNPVFKSRPADPEDRIDKLAGEKRRPATAPPKPPQEDTSIRFSLGDFLHRIPPQLLKPGPYEPGFELRFDAADVAERIAHGNTTISLVEVYKRAPHIFRGEIRESDNIDIRFPWQKLMHLVRPDTRTARREGVTQAAADSLAAQVHSRKQEAATAGGTADVARAKSRSAGRQPSWFSRPAEKPVPFGTPATPTATSDIGPEQPPSPAEADLDIAALAAELTSLTEQQILPSPTPPPAAPSSAPPAGSIGRDREPQLALGLTGEQQPATDAITAERDAAALEAACVKAEHKTQLAALTEERQELAEQRDKLTAELEKARRQIDEESGQAELQKSLAARSTENIAKSDGVRAALQETVDAQVNELERFKKQIEELKNAGADKLEEIARERDALVQQKNHLSDQLAQVRHRRGAASSEPTESAPRGGQVERSKREYQRQIEELHRRIAAFENNQKEAAHELGKEREARIKVERALAAAERVRAEATALVESTRNETRRELETTLRKREAEFARAQQEMQEQIDSLTQAKRDATTEHEQLLARAEEEENKTRAEREQLHARIADLDHAATAAVAGARPPAGTGWESRAVASLEADIESYRTRVKALLQERDGWSKEREKLAADLTEHAGASSLAASSEAALRDLTATNEKLSTDLAAAASERDRLVEQIRASEQRLTKAEHALSRLDALIKERDEANGELTRVKALLAQIGADHQLHLAGLHEKHDALLREKSDTVRQLEEIKLTQAAELQREATARAADQSELAQLRVQVERLTAARDAAIGEREKLLSGSDLLKAKSQEDEAKRSLDEQRETVLAKLRQEQFGFGNVRMELEQRLAAALHENEALTSRVESFARSAHETIESPHKHDDDRARVPDVHERTLAAACAERDQARARIVDLEARFSAETTALARERDQTAHETAALAQRVAALDVESERMLSDLRGQCDALASERRAALAELKITQEAHEAQRDTFAREREAAIRQRDEALAAAERMRVGTQQKAFVLHRERTELQQLEADVSVRFDHETARLRRERDTLLHQRDELRERISRMVADQRDLLEEIIEEPSHPTATPIDVRPRPREAHETNVIDITAAVVMADTEANIDLPRVRPVAVPPPQLRVL